MSIDAKFSLVKGDFKLDVELTLPGRGVSAVFGPSGCGKTTLLRLIAGLERCQHGYLKVGDRVWQDGNDYIPPHKRAIGYVFQEASLFSHLDVKGNLEYGVKRVPIAERRVSIDQGIELLGIGHLLNRKADQLSGGEKQRVAIARALAVSPKILLMDEPLSALDLALKREIMPYLESLHGELDIPVIYVSHSPDEVARLADHLVLLDRGRVRADGPIASMLTRLDLPLAYGDDAAAVIDACVTEHDDHYGVSYLEFAGGQFTVARNSLPIGQAVRLRIVARDVSLTLEQQTGTSILNIFAATVAEIISDEQPEVVVRLMAGGVPLLSRITRKSAAQLNLECGQMVFAQIKSVALLSDDKKH
ncbi:molybdenum ABC transporter ATP-binding protein [Alkalimarinus sediminis]|uniref:Molybdenum ABC transporter ATP-binding protein n=1 Tax=Alkalimarinus sediminis TaxID=1632866 RepID=A0A9E8KK19_9ALTE|nr:molybdenum ABC transporter ATP-binding protein [Alkalimarinus sediminis]UZW75636.1 molybdenum ABC transporter ATP-binding protein [Alkalimarinus sediminis]